MSVKRLVFCFLVILIFVDICQGAKKGKKKTPKKQKAGKKTKTKTVVELDDAGVPRITAVNKAPYKMERDKDYWSGGGSQRRYRLEDSPHHNEEFLRLYTIMRDAIMPDGVIIKDAYDLTIKQNEVHFLTHREMIERLYVMKVYYLVNGRTSDYVHTIFAAHVDTKNGTDIPPILMDNKACSVEVCTGYFSSDGIPYTRYISESDYFLPLEEGLVSRMAEEYLSKFEHILNTYTIEEAREMLCEPIRLKVLKFWLAAELSLIAPQVGKFMREPRAYDKYTADTNLDKTHDYMNGNMLTDFLHNFCEK